MASVTVCAFCLIILILWMMDLPRKFLSSFGDLYLFSPVSQYSVELSVIRFYTFALAIMAL